MISSNLVLQFDILTVSVFLTVLQLIAVKTTVYNTVTASCDTQHTSSTSLLQQ